MMKEDRHEKLKLSNELLDAMLVGVKTQEDLWGKEGIITQLNKALLGRILMPRRLSWLCKLIIVISLLLQYNIILNNLYRRFNHETYNMVGTSSFCASKHRNAACR